MKKLLFTLGTATTIIAPIATVVSCGKTDTKDKNEIDLDMTSKLKSAKTIMAFKKNFYDGQATGAKTVVIDAAAGAHYELKLTAEQVKKVEDAGEIAAVTKDMPFADFISTMKSVTGGTHQFYFAKADADKLGVSFFGIGGAPTVPQRVKQKRSLFHPLKGLSNLAHKAVDAVKSGAQAVGSTVKDAAGSLSHHHVDVEFTKAWFLKNLIGTLPDGIEMTKFDPTKGNNMDVTFTKGDESDKVKFHLAHKNTQEEADAANAKGGSKFYHAIHAVTQPIKKVAGELKVLAEFAHEQGIDKKEFLTGVAESFIDGFVDKAATFVPFYGEVIHIPFVGGKVSGFVDDHLVNPIVEHLIP